MWEKLTFILAFLLMLIMAALGYFFVKGTTAKSTDQRRAVMLSAAEKDLVLGEMRAMLRAVNGIVDALSKNDMPRAAEAASTAGMGMAADVSPVLMMKLPLDFKELGIGTHQRFDQFAADLKKGGMTQGAALERLSIITSRCVACHEANRLGIAP